MSSRRLLILDLLFDDESIEEMAAHGITPRQALEVIDNGPRIARNRKRRRATHLVVGLDHGGACIAMPVERTADRAVWRPITAWYCKPHEVQWIARR